MSYELCDVTAFHLFVSLRKQTLGKHFPGNATADHVSESGEYLDTIRFSIRQQDSTGFRQAIR